MTDENKGKKKDKPKMEKDELYEDYDDIQTSSKTLVLKAPKIPTSIQR